MNKINLQEKFEKILLIQKLTVRKGKVPDKAEEGFENKMYSKDQKIDSEMWKDPDSETSVFEFEILVFLT